MAITMTIITSMILKLEAHNLIQDTTNQFLMPIHLESWQHNHWQPVYVLNFKVHKPPDRANS